MWLEQKMLDKHKVKQKIRTVIDALLADNAKVKHAYDALVQKGYTQDSAKDMLGEVFLFHYWKNQEKIDQGQQPDDISVFEQDLLELERYGLDFIR